jgi:N-acetylglucosaminyl-diphospho-decaprenol L-rhamnosyltransferase
MKVSIDIILVNRNSGSLIRTCIESIASSDKNDYSISNVIVVDDCSNDNSLFGIEEIELPVKIIQNQDRKGYGASCNIGAFAGTAELLLFLNTDIKLNKYTLDISVKNYVKLKEENVGILGIQLLEIDGKISRCTSRFPTPGNLIVETLFLNKAFPRLFKGIQVDWDHRESRVVDQVMGAFILISRELFERVDGYSKNFFVYMEDLDLSLRLNKIGYKNFYLTDATALHLGGGTARKFWWESLFFLYRSRIQYSFVHFGIFNGLIIAICCLFIGPFIRVIYQILKGNFYDVKSIIKSTFHLYLWTIKACFKSLMPNS